MDNAIAHVLANCLRHPNSGLVNALNHLIANKARHEAHKPGGPDGNSHGGGNASSNGHATGRGGGKKHS